MRRHLIIATLGAGLSLGAAAFAVEPATPPSEQPTTGAGRTVEKAGNAAGKAVDDVDRAGSDAWATAKIKAKILEDSEARKAVVHVDVHQHVVTLTGSAPDESAHDKVVKLALDTNGVQKVVDRVAVTPQP
jgi:osmotically-inducible protein OsmY